MYFNPLVVASHWPIPNYADPVTRGPELWILTAIFLFAATCCVAVRLYWRIFLRRWLGLDDLLVVLALMFSGTVTTFVAIGTLHYDWDRHIWDVPVNVYSRSARILYFSRIFWGVAASFVRLSVLCLYYRLVHSIRAPNKYYWALHVTTAFTIGLLMFYLIVGITPCIPIRAYWAFPNLDGARCLNDGAAMQASAVLNTLNESIVATLPLLAVFRLRVDRRQRWSVIGLLSLGYLVAVVGCIRTYYIWKALSSYDLTWWATPQWICSEVELDLALMCACAAPMRPVISRLYHRLHGVSVPRVRVPRAFSGNRIKNISQQGSGTNFSRDYEAMAEWQHAISRTFDIEGIANDGLGYSVKISGPGRSGRRSLRYLRERFRGAKNEREERDDRNLEECKAGLEISHKTEVTVRTSWHSGLFGDRKWPGRHTSDVDQIEMSSTHDRKQSVDILDLGRAHSIPESTKITFQDDRKPSVHEPITPNSAFLQDSHSVESLEALPTMPPPATQAPERPLQHASSLMRLLPHRRPSKE